MLTDIPIRMNQRVVSQRLPPVAYLESPPKDANVREGGAEKVGEMVE